MTAISGVGRGGIGLAGQWGVIGASHQEAVVRMLAAADHRGPVHRIVATPDGAVGVSGDEGVEGTARLGEFALAFSGTIDNAEDFGAGRGARGDEIAGAVLKRIAEGGLDSVAASLRGAFALVVLRPDGLWFCRDHLGLGSMFFRHAAEGAWVASEPKQIVAGSEIRREPDLEVVEALFLGSASEDTPSALKGVERAPRAEVGHLGRARPRFRRYWHPEELLETSGDGPEDFPDKFEHLMFQAVRRTMNGESAVALSGGVDSPAVAAFAAPVHREMYGSPVLAVSYVYPDHPSVDESRYIELVSDRLDIPLHTRVSTARPTDGLAEWVRLFDTPFPVVSVAESADFYRWTASLGPSVLLTGEWAEYVTEMSPHVLAHLLFSGRWGAAVEHVRLQRRLGRPVSTISRRLGRSLLSDRALHGVRRLTKRRKRYPRPAWITAPEPPVASTRSRDRWHDDQIAFFTGSGVLLDASNTITAMTRLDVRRPFADIDLWEAFLRLRAEYKHGNPRTKGLLRSLLRDRVPDEILDRRDKTVFDADLFSKIDYEALERWLVDPKYRLSWIDYDLVADSLSRRSLDLLEFMWMKDLAAVHAFLEQW